MPILSPNALEVISRSAEQTRRIGMRLGSLLCNGDLVALEGDLGSGKTTFVQGVAAGWGSLDTVTSPTFVLINVYQRPSLAQKPLGEEKLYHFDAYRLTGTAEQVLTQAVDLDIEMMLTTGVLVVEWAERVLEALPKEMLRIQFSLVDEQQRDLVITAIGERYKKMLTDLRYLIYGG